MRFDIILQKILESLDTIPAFDGYREVYGFSSTSPNEDSGFERFSQKEIENLWDHWENVYMIPNDDDENIMEPMDNFGYEFDSSDREKFFALITKETEELSREYNDMKGLPKAVEMLRNKIPVDAPGVYRYFGNNDHGDFWWGFEFDVTELRKKDIIQRLNNQDTSGLEDLF